MAGASRTSTGRVAHAELMTSMVSARCGEHVTYPTTPPGRVRLTAEIRSRRWSWVNSSTSVGVRRHRASGRRRSDPRPEHGTSARTAAKDCFGSGGCVPSAVITRWSPGMVLRAFETRSARCSCSSTAVKLVSCWFASPASSADLPPGPAHRSSHWPKQLFALAARTKARMTSWEPSSCMPARPSRTAATSEGFPGRTTPHGEYRVGVPDPSSSRSASPRRTTKVGTGGSLSASKASSTSSAPRRS